MTIREPNPDEETAMVDVADVGHAESSGMNLISRIRFRTWVAAYELEEARQAHAAHHRYLRSAGCCLALSILSILRWPA